MALILNLNVHPTLSTSLRLTHDKARTEFSRAAQGEGPLAQAAKRAVLIYLPHFGREEQTILPVLDLVPDLAQGALKPEWAGLLPLISEFTARHDPRSIEDEWVLSAAEELQRVAHREKNQEFVELAYSLKEHERIEHEVAYPAVMVIGNYLRAHLGA